MFEWGVFWVIVGVFGLVFLAMLGMEWLRGRERMRKLQARAKTADGMRDIFRASDTLEQTMQDVIYLKDTRIHALEHGLGENIDDERCSGCKRMLYHQREYCPLFPGEGGGHKWRECVCLVHTCHSSGQ